MGEVRKILTPYGAKILAAQTEFSDDTTNGTMTYQLLSEYDAYMKALAIQSNDNGKKILNEDIYSYLRAVFIDRLLNFHDVYEEIDILIT